MFFLHVWFEDIKKAKTAAIVFGVITACFLLAALAFFAVQSLKIHSYNQVSATVTAFDTRDGNNVWTEFSYPVEGELYNVRLKGHSYWMRINSEVTLLVNPKNPSQAAVLYDNPYTLPLIMLIAAGVFGLFLFLYTVNYLVLRKSAGPN